MTNEEKQLLIKDLCARLPYGVMCNTEDGNGILISIECSYGEDLAYVNFGYEEAEEYDLNGNDMVKPYLRSISSMTKEEKYTYRHMLGATLNSEGESIMLVYVEDFPTVIDWLNKHHFDFRGLIEKGLALEAPMAMYKTQ